MNSKLVSVLAAVCVVCALIIIGEWFYAVKAQKQTLASITSSETTQPDGQMPEIELTQESEESYGDLVARPLFIKGRKPVDEPSSEEVQTIAVANNFDWQLNGVYSTKKGLSALLSRSTAKVPKDNYRKITVGADLDGWKLTEIHKDSVILKQGSLQKDLPLRKPKPKALSRNTTRSNAPNISESRGGLPDIPQPTESIPTEGIPDIPQPTEGIPDIPQPAEGEFENNNE
jgi:hypothetical protein